MVLGNILKKELVKSGSLGVLVSGLVDFFFLR